VVGVKGSKVFCLQLDSMKTVDVPQSASMHKFIQKGDVQGAHSIALLGVTESDWKLLGHAPPRLSPNLNRILVQLNRLCYR
jgi:intraflagellar transport protein 122